MSYVKKNLRFALILLTLAVSSCSQAPDVHPLFIDTELKECVEHAVLDKENFTISDKPVRIWPLEHCDGNISMTMKEFKQMKDYILEQKKKCVGVK